ncbi:hypothetical protein ACH4SP_35140 [Streptomyces sp. NPDC021093]|uniref:hypothetical protein n=1 Tax=Streptomyces sp. NPDC021093 TaxID=3365112 RepID=UPI0037A50BE5
MPRRHRRRAHRRAHPPAFDVHTLSVRITAGWRDGEYADERAAQALFAVDGEPLIDPRQKTVEGLDPWILFGPGSTLWPTRTPHLTHIACGFRCVVECCGLYVLVSTPVPGYVDWDVTLRRDMYGPPAAPHHFRFEREQYLYVLETTRDDHSWEWPTRTVMRLVGERLEEERLFTGLGCIDHSYWWREDPVVGVCLRFPGDDPSDPSCRKTFTHSRPVTSAPPHEQAEEFLRTLQESFRSWADRGK